ncbi:hypothetical protein N7520_011506 [Penicillium odoratum]|uniref:uncharacterized protein n=1 Tax=Penicillium odoratum TaxID=1167516 RepID=UPI0025479EEE|nr:uncharacterized protein N7520_011506 [Penicillium odoratum]KAJ5746324.1 hypothetical protein N7520_011506 [Penicillium odoratum]
MSATQPTKGDASLPEKPAKLFSRPSGALKATEHHLRFLWECYTSNPANQTDYVTVAVNLGITKNAAISRFCRLKKHMQDCTSSTSGSAAEQNDLSPKTPARKRARTQINDSQEEEDDPNPKKTHKNSQRVTSAAD